jgi:uncharacterized protein
MAKDLFQHTNSEAELYLVDGANHGESFAMQKAEYKNKVQHFLSNYLNLVAEK